MVVIERGTIKEDLYKEFSNGEVLYDVDESIEKEGAEEITLKYYNCVCNSNSSYDRINGISKIKEGYIFKIGDSYNSFHGTVVKHSMKELEKRLELNKKKEIKEDVKREGNMKEKYLIVSKYEKGKVSEIEMFRDSDLDQNLETLKKYEDMTAKRFSQEIKYLDKTQLEGEQKKVRIANKKIKDKEFER